MIRAHILICAGAGCISSGGHALKDVLAAELKKRGLDGKLKSSKRAAWGHATSAR